MTVTVPPIRCLARFEDQASELGLGDVMADVADALMTGNLTPVGDAVLINAKGFTDVRAP